MTLGEKSQPTVDVNRFVEEETYGQVLEEIESNVRRKILWAKALQKSRGNEHKANTLYLEYRAQSIKDEAEIAKALSREPSVTIIQNYITKMERHEPEKKKRLQNVPSNLMSQKYQEKKCYKCGKKMPLAEKPCPYCSCNSYIFCD